MKLTDQSDMPCKMRTLQTCQNFESRCIKELKEFVGDCHMCLYVCWGGGGGKGGGGVLMCG